MALKGKALLKPIENDPDNGWSLEKIDIDSESLNFQNGSVVTKDSEIEN